MPDPARAIRSALKSQYHAALAMLREGIEKCPPDLWYSTMEIHACWQIAYHTLYFAHLYMQPAADHFKPWAQHQSNVQNEDGIAGPPDPDSALPLIPEPYTREQALEYWSFCDGMVDDAMDTIDPLSAESGFSWYKISKLEHQIVNIRHIQIGAAQLAARLRSTLKIGLPWVGSRPAGSKTNG